MTKRKTFKDLHAKWMKEPGYAAAYAELEGEYKVASAIIAVRSAAKLSQAQLADRMHTKQTVIARLESGRVLPTTRTLERIAQATGHQMEIRFVKGTTSKLIAGSPSKLMKSGARGKK